MSKNVCKYYQIIFYLLFYVVILILTKNNCENISKHAGLYHTITTFKKLLSRMSKMHAIAKGGYFQELTI